MNYMICIPSLEIVSRENCERIHNILARISETYKLNIVPEPVKMKSSQCPDYYKKYAAEHPGEHARADVIVVDPPRKGCEETLLETMVQMEPEKIVYVSCDSATLARDLKYLCANGYELKRVRAVDQFPMTVHVESVVLLKRTNI